MNKKIAKRLLLYLLGLFVMTMGIAISVKSDMGVSPVSSIPYTMTCVWGIEMGLATIIFHIFLVILQFLILRKSFKATSLMQVVVGIVFGYFTTFCNWCASFLPSTDNIIIRVLMVLCSVVLVAAGIFLYMPPNIMPLAGEGTMKAISDKFHIEFSKVKICFDISMVVISLATCLIAIHAFGSVGFGTVISALLVGVVLGVITKRFGERYNHFCMGEVEPEQEKELEADIQVQAEITVSETDDKSQESA